MTEDEIKAASTHVSLEDQIKCVRRELAMRARVYPRWVNIQKMKQIEADKEQAAMQAVHDTLMRLQSPPIMTKLPCLSG